MLFRSCYSGSAGDRILIEAYRQWATVIFGTVFSRPGKKSSPVVRDPALETKSPKTVYLFNYMRGEFLEYSREIVEPKLRELNSDDVFVTELKRAFKAARKSFSPGRAVPRREVTPVHAPRKGAGRADVDEFLIEEMEGFTPGEEDGFVEDDAYG